VNGFWISQQVELFISVPPEEMSQVVYSEYLVGETHRFVREDERVDPVEMRRFFNLDGAELQEMATYRQSKSSLTSSCMHTGNI